MVPNMKQMLVLSLLVVCVTSQSFLWPIRSSLYPILDVPLTASALPKNWRTTLQKPTLKANLKGLDKLKISGSGQFSEQAFLAIAHQISSSHLAVLDLREESHGLINGNAISWIDGFCNYANVGKSQREIEEDEHKRLQLAAEKKSIIINPHQEAYRFLVSQVKTERDLVESLGYIYMRLPVTDHHAPSNQTLDQFIAFVKNLPSDTWIHFHCKAGKGRTTTFMTLYDMMLNAHDVSLEDIIARQWVIGGVDLTSTDKAEDHRQRGAIKLLRLIRDFYSYCQQVPAFHLSWSEWLAQQPSLAANPSIIY
jgi:hypothetical protein